MSDKHYVGIKRHATKPVFAIAFPCDFNPKESEKYKNYDHIEGPMSEADAKYHAKRIIEEDTASRAYVSRGTFEHWDGREETSR